jgi:hypothetical protein
LLRLPPDRRRLLLGDHAAPPRRVIALGLAEQLHRLALAAHDRLHGLEPEHLAIDGCITKAPGGGQVAGPSPVDRRQVGLPQPLPASGAVTVPSASVPFTTPPAGAP